MCSVECVCVVSACVVCVCVVSVCSVSVCVGVCVVSVMCVQWVFPPFYFPHAPLYCVILHAGEIISCII